jgi:hypothetical protein
MRGRDFVAIVLGLHVARETADDLQPFVALRGRRRFSCPVNGGLDEYAAVTSRHCERGKMAQQTCLLPKLQAHCTMQLDPTRDVVG